MIFFLLVASVATTQEQDGAVLELTGQTPSVIYGLTDASDSLTLTRNASEDKLICCGEFEAADLRIAGTSTTVADLIREVATLRQDMAAVKQFVGMMPPPAMPPPASPPPDWKLIFRQTVTAGNDWLWASHSNEWIVNADDPSSLQYSIMGHLENYRAADGTFTFKLAWPQYGTYNTWKQSSNPATSDADLAATGYSAIDIQESGNAWGGGLAKSSRAAPSGNGSWTLMDATPTSGYFFYAVGLREVWTGNSGIPGPRLSSVNQVELFVWTSA